MPPYERKPIEVLDIRPVNQKALQAYVILRVGGITIHDMRIIQQPDQKAWVGAPQQVYEKKGSDKKHYKSFVEFTDSLKQRVDTIILEEWKTLEAKANRRVG